MSHVVPPSAARVGIVALAGLPNAGKSTLLNFLIGEKLSIVSPKPQTTRDRIVGIRTTPHSQMVFVDTPGLLEPRYMLHRAMRHTALAALEGADVIVHLVDASAGTPETTDLTHTARLEKPFRCPVVLVLNKLDLLSELDRANWRERHPRAEFVSATTGAGTDALIATLDSLLPESPFLYPVDEISTQTVRFFVGELVRETALEQLDDEVPYSVACEIEEYRESASPVYIRAVLHVERESQKRILIGAKGQRVRAIGQEARRKIEHLIDAPVYLDLWVKVLPNWRRNAHALHRLGYHLPEDRSS